MPYAVSGTDVVFGGICLRAPYAESGADIAHQVLERGRRAGRKPDNGSADPDNGNPYPGNGKTYLGNGKTYLGIGDDVAGIPPSPSKMEIESHRRRAYVPPSPSKMEIQSLAPLAPAQVSRCSSPSSYGHLWCVCDARALSDALF